VQRISPIAAALVAQIFVKLLFAPRNAASDAAFYHRARRALIAGLVAHVIVRIFLARWQRLQFSSGTAGQSTQIKGLMAICVLAGLFAVIMPPLFKEIATSGVVPIDPSDLVFAIPVILVTLVGVIHTFRGYKN
jgi:hypothetical protein